MVNAVGTHTSELIPQAVNVPPGNMLHQAANVAISEAVTTAVKQRLQEAGLHSTDGPGAQHPTAGTDPPSSGRDIPTTEATSLVSQALGNRFWHLVRFEQPIIIFSYCSTSHWNPRKDQEQNFGE